jgi:serine/threonine protein kinase/Flp pilus assembly protein TadD
MSEQHKPEDADRTWKIRASEPDPLDARGQKRELLAEQQADWAANRPAPPEHYLERWPTDPRQDPDAASLLVAEIFQRRERGEQPTVDHYEKRFPEHSRMLDALVRHQDMIQSLTRTGLRGDRMLRFPSEGEELFGFRLRRPLGRGAFARVYLAEQPDLACRPVVLKVSAIEGSEHHTLARLQHTNIVPIFSVHLDERAGLRAVCMPYFGGETLSRILEQLWNKTTRPTHGGQLVETLEELGSQPVRANTEDPTSTDATQRQGSERADQASPAESRAPLAVMRGLNYDKAVAWIVAQLADGLHHAHERGILHRDVKPSNILLSAEGQPLLLDFNVAQEMDTDTAQAILGGTVAYAAPEHLVALRDCTPDLIRCVDRRSDLYSLGLVLAEMVTGGHLFEQGGSYSARATQIEAMVVERSRNIPSLREVRRDVPWSLESITRKCLDPDPARRYQHGSQLADDLRRFIEDRPLKYAPELSGVEQVQKFFRRHPKLTTSGSITAAAAVLLLIVGAALVGARAHLAEASSQLRSARSQERKRAHDAGAVRALCLVNTTLGQQDHLLEGIDVCEQTLALYHLPDDRPCEAHPDWSSLPPEERRQLAEDHRELLLLLAGARVRLARGDRPTLVRSLALLDEAEAIRCLVPSKALWLDRANYLSQLGLTSQAQSAQQKADSIPTASAREHYLLAISYSRQGGPDDYRKAIAQLNQALNLQPRHYWSAMQRGICHMELGESAQAIGDFGTCIGLWPEHPWAYFNRGYVLDRIGMKADAIDDYTAAIHRDKTFAAALVNRGLARLELKQYAPALADFDQSLAISRHAGASLFAGRGLALEALGRHAEADAAFQRAFSLAPYPDPAFIRIKWTYAFAVSARLPEQARLAFDDVLRHDPRHPQALYGQAMLAMSRGDLAVALQFFNQVLTVNPTFTEARRYRAVLLSRQHDWEHATRDINWCLDREPASGETLYAAACVAARAAEASHSPRSLDVAFDLLERARSLGSGQNASADPDLTALRSDPRFTRLMATALRPNQPDRAAGSTFNSHAR